MSDKLVLASSSPRRVELLKASNINFSIVDHQFDELSINEHNPVKYAKLLAEGKAKSIAVLPNYTDEYILGVDTIVVINNCILGKPKDRKEAENFMRLLSNKKHRVLSGISLINNAKSIKLTKCAVSYVDFIKINDNFLKFYLDNNHWEGYAGGYAIQGIFSLIVKKIQGEYTNIVGLPINLLYCMLKEIKFRTF